MTKTRSDLIRAWCEKGRRDFITAQNALLDTREIFPDIICFHAQQAAENISRHIWFILNRSSQTHTLLKISFSLPNQKIP